MRQPIGRATVKHAFGGQRSGELDIIEGQTIQLLDTEGADLPEGFWRGRLENGNTGLFPQNFVDQIELWPPVEQHRRASAERSCSTAKSAAPRLGAAFYGCCAAHWVSLMLGYQAEYLIWQAHFPGNFAAQARVMGTVLSAGSVLSFVLNPVMAALADAFGRRPLLLLGSTTSCFKYCLIGMMPTVPSVAVGSLLVCSLDAWMLGSFASAGDVYGNDPAALGQSFAWLQMMPFIGILVSPVIGGRLASISVRAPYLAAGVAYLLQTLATAFCVPETLPRKLRRGFTLRAASPLSVLTLFRRGQKLRALAILTALNELCNGRPLRMICDTQKDQVLGWTPTERGRFNSWAGATTLPSFVGASRVISVLGSRWVVILGILGYMAELAVSRNATRQLTFYWARLLGVGSFVANVALSSRLNLAGAEAGINQGELQGATQNLQQLCQILGPIGWGNLYGWLSRSGSGRELYTAGAAMGALMVMIVPFASLGTTATEPTVQSEIPETTVSTDDGDEHRISAADESPSSTSESRKKMNMAEAIAAISEELGLPRGTAAKDVSWL
jgi:DHA1 family tetracycline resistance protein-like MFS transporter